MRLRKLALLIPAIAYQVLVIAAAVKQMRQQSRTRRSEANGKSFRPGVSVLKPLRGLDPNTEAALLSQVQQDYPEFEVLFGVHDASDPAIPAVRRLQSEFPSVSIRLVIGARNLPNAKVGTLSVLAEQARYPIWIVNDGDIRVDKNYLASVVGPLENSSIGVVTCPYRAMAHTVPAGWESLGITTDFMPSTFVAQILGVREFGLGSTLAFRAEDLAKAGGFFLDRQLHCRRLPVGEARYQLGKASAPFHLRGRNILGRGHLVRCLAAPAPVGPHDSRLKGGRLCWPSNYARWPVGAGRSLAGSLSSGFCAAWSAYAFGASIQSVHFAPQTSLFPVLARAGLGSLCVRGMGSLLFREDGPMAR